MQRLLVFLVAAAVLAGGAWWYLRPKPAPAQPQYADLNIYLTCDVSGRIEPCGCFTGQYGGLTRVHSTMQKSSAPSLKLDAGDAIAGVEDYQVLEFKHVLGAFGRMGWHAVNLGRREAQLSAPVLRDLAKTSAVPLVSANVLDAATDQPLVQPWIATVINGVRVAVTGVVDPDRMRGKSARSVKVAAMSDALRKVIPEMKAAADVLVCLAFTDDGGMEQIARDFYELSVVLGGDVAQPSSSARKVNQSWLIATTNQSRALAELHSTWDFAAQRLTAVAGDVRLMSDDIPQSPVITAFSGAWRKEVRTAKLSVDEDPDKAADRVPGVKAHATWVGSEACAACHRQAFDVWSKSRHAHAFESLVRKDSDADPSCIGCHVTGFRESGGYHRSMKAEKLVNVGCESCHGPGSEHVKLRASAIPGEEVLVKMRPVGQGQCVQCHHGEFSRPFVWDQFWPAIRHGKEQK